MSPEMLRTELDRAEDAELQSEEQLRQLVSMIDKVGTLGSSVNASDCAKTVTAALALNDGYGIEPKPCIWRYKRRPPWLNPKPLPILHAAFD